MSMRPALASPSPRREPSYRNALPPRPARNRLNPLQFEALLEGPGSSRQLETVRMSAGLWQRLRSLFVPLMVQKFPPAGQ